MSSLVSARSPAHGPVPRLPSSPAAFARTRSLLALEHDVIRRVLWATLSQLGPAHISTDLLADWASLSARIRDGRYGALRYRVISSDVPNIFSLGGDLALFVESIESGDKQALENYGRTAIDEIWANLTGSGNSETITVSLVEGDAQGGGFEAALSCHIMVAESGTSLGFPESLFGLFPGMGAAQLLAARTDLSVANRLISKPNRYSADFLYEIGVIDYLVAKGEGRPFVRDLVSSPPSPRVLLRADKLKRIPYATLIQSVDVWVETAMGLSSRNLRSMRYLLNAQKRMQQLR